MPQIIVEVLLSLVLGIVGANFGNDSELKDISWRTEMRKRYGPCNLLVANVLTCVFRPIEQMINPSLTFPEFKSGTKR
jgi:hypothetical protein